MSDATIQKEADRIKETANLMATAHHRESERYARYDHLLTWGGVAASIVLVGFVFSPPENVRTIVGLSPTWFSRLAGLASMITLFTSVFQIGWKPGAKAARHEEAADHYTAVKHSANRLFTQDTITDQEFAQLQGKHLDRAHLPTIPDARFLRTKQWHKRKVALSRALDEQPHKPLREIKSELKRYGTLLPLEKTPGAPKS